METKMYTTPDKGKTVYTTGANGNKEQVGNISLKSNMDKKIAVVFGAGGFIGNHLVKRLISEGYWVRGVDLKLPEYDSTWADDFLILDLREKENVKTALSINGKISEVYQLAADMGGAGFVFSGENDFNIMHNSSQINLNVLNTLIELNMFYTTTFYSSSACMYPEHNQTDPDNPNCEESSAYPANPDSEYGWEKLFSERMYLAAKRNYNLNVKIARLHNIFGPYGTYTGGREKAPAAICRKIAELPETGGEIEVWGDGNQTRSFLYINECIEGIRRLVKSEFNGPVNIGSDEMVTINKLVQYVADIANKNVIIKHINGPLGVRGRNSDNKLINDKLSWSPKYPLKSGLVDTYSWIKKQVDKKSIY